MRFRSLIAACVLPLAPLSVYGCSSDPTTEDLCGWLRNPNAANCVSEFHEDIKDKCGSVDKTAVNGSFGMRATLDSCVLAKGGSVVFDPPIDITKFPADMPTTMKIVSFDGTPCGEIAYLSAFSWSFNVDAPMTMGTGGAGAGGGAATTTGAGGAEEQAESHYSKGKIAITRAPGRDAVDVSCPAPDLVAAGAVAVPETHSFNLNQVLSSTPSTGCPQYSEIIPQAILDLDPGGIGREGSLRLKIQYPPEAVKATTTTSAGGGTTTTSGSTAVAMIPPEVVYYFDCAIPAAPLVCQDAVKDASETDVDCGGPESSGACPVRCMVGQKCVTPCDCDDSSTCAVDTKSGLRLCTASATASTFKASCAKPLCSDAKQDGGESDVDCGGTCSACANGMKCAKNADCMTNVCTAGVCAAM